LKSFVENAAGRQPRLVRWETVAHSPPKQGGGQKGRPTTSTSEPPGRKFAGESTMISEQTPAEATPRHSPDWNAAADYRTSYD